MTTLRLPPRTQPDPQLAPPGPRLVGRRGYQAAEGETGRRGQAGVHVATRSRTMQSTGTGGDWGDALPLAPGVVGMTVGDVTGHDLVAATARRRLRARLRQRATQGDSPSTVLDDLDQLAQHLPDERLATALYGQLVLDSDGAMLRYANAGHLPPLVQDIDGTVRLLDGGHSVLLGAPTPTVRTEACAVLAAGSTLLLYTDGLIERRRRTLDEGLHLLGVAVAEHHPSAGPAALCERLLRMLVPDSPQDDVLALAVQLEQPTARRAAL